MQLTLPSPGRGSMRRGVAPTVSFSMRYAYTKACVNAGFTWAMNGALQVNAKFGGHNCQRLQGVQCAVWIKQSG